MQMTCFLSRSVGDLLFIIQDNMPRIVSFFLLPSPFLPFFSVRSWNWPIIGCFQCEDSFLWFWNVFIFQIIHFIISSVPSFWNSMLNVGRPRLTSNFFPFSPHSLSFINLLYFLYYFLHCSPVSSTEFFISVDMFLIFRVLPILILFQSTLFSEYSVFYH